MDPRRFNFSSGPAVLPEPVLLQLREELWSIDGTGIGIAEHSHRGPLFDHVLADAQWAVREVSGLDDEWEVLFLQGGATMHFALIPMNFLGERTTAAFADTGTWTAKAIAEAKRYGKVDVLWSGKDTHWDRVPKQGDLPRCDGARYFHYCSNNTIEGTQYAGPLDVGAPLVCDASSDIFSRRYDLGLHALVFAGSQKNIGMSGNVLVLVRREFLATAREDLSPMLSYRAHAAAGSRLNTPNTLGIRALGLCCRWILDQGGVAAIEARNEAKAQLLYHEIDMSGGFYRGCAHTTSRSRMNVTFRLASESLEQAFAAEAARNDLDGLAGHRSFGGIRASIYNAMPHAGCEALASFMREFMRTRG
ncbi:MAG: 3-phosphoserine/phosphohydroxythreonine transaminase [Phycisphaerae bacterium]|jgi:phosphoserine aminotransferase|nr:3-phosphoserine/phosphohydroxythreonine transaminase [Phycisphaerae bacterium]